MYIKPSIVTLSKEDIQNFVMAKASAEQCVLKYCSSGATYNDGCGEGTTYCAMGYRQN